MNEQIAQLNRLYKEQDGIYHSIAARSGMSDATFWVMYVVASSEQAYNQNDLCNEWFYPKQTVNSAIRSLRENGYLELKQIPGKRNSKAIVLTQTGKAFCDKSVYPLLQAEESSFGELTAEEQGMFLTLLRKQVNALRSKAKDL